MTSDKLQAVKAVLSSNTTIRDWYATEHNLTADMLTVESVRTYGTGGHGDLADQILEDAGIDLVD